MCLSAPKPADPKVPAQRQAAQAPQTAAIRNTSQRRLMAGAVMTNPNGMGAAATTKTLLGQ